MGDFKLDARMEFRNNYHHKIPLGLQTDFALSLNLKWLESSGLHCDQYIIGMTRCEITTETWFWLSGWS